jgi:hypothetical protein
MMEVVMVDPMAQQTENANKAKPPGIPLSHAYAAASIEQRVVDVSPALNIKAFATGLACCMLAF